MDRNPPVDTSSIKESLSLSARRAWIEIAGTMGKSKRAIVALRKESVDRNSIGSINRAIDISRSPQGERG